MWNSLSWNLLIVFTYTFSWTPVKTVFFYSGNILHFLLAKVNSYNWIKDRFITIQFTDLQHVSASKLLFSSDFQDDLSQNLSISCLADFSKKIFGGTPGLANAQPLGHSESPAAPPPRLTRWESLVLAVFSDKLFSTSITVNDVHLLFTYFGGSCSYRPLRTGLKNKIGSLCQNLVCNEALIQFFH